MNKEITLSLEAAENLKKKLAFIKKAEAVIQENKDLKGKVEQLKNTVEALESCKEANTLGSYDIGRICSNTEHSHHDQSVDITDDNYEEEMKKLAHEINNIIKER